MGIIDDVLVGVKSVTDKANDKANEFIDVSKIKFNGASLKNDLNRKYYILGKAIYHNAPQSVIDRIKGEIDDLVDDIKENNDKLNNLKNKKKCPVCGCEYSAKDNVCPICSD